MRKYAKVTSTACTVVLLLGCTSNQDSSIDSETTISSSNVSETIAVTTSLLQSSTTHVEIKTGSFQACPSGQELNDHDNDGWGGCIIPTTTTIDPEIKSGTYVVGAEIEPGLYRVAGYWARLDATMEIIDNDGVYENGVSLLNVQPTDVYVEISGVALPLGETRTLDPVIEKFTSGTYLVNWDIQPGRYKITPVDDNAYFARLDTNGEIIDNNLSEGQLIVIVDSSDWALTISGSIEYMP